MKTYDLIVIGGGPAGLAAAISARMEGVSDILVLERDNEPGGILNQCIHNGFGLHTFKEELTGPEYAGRYILKAAELDIPVRLKTMALDIREEPPYKIVTALNREDGLLTLRTRTVILAMGCRERPRGALNIPGFRPAGIYTAGTAQRLVNMDGYMPGRQVVILGSGDIGLIMARRMTLEGASVKAVAELMPYSGGLQRNIVQCLEDFGIPLKLSHTVTRIHGRDRVTGVTLAQVDEKGKPMTETEEQIPCDTLLLSCGLIPENELSEKLGAALSPVTNGPLVNESLETNIPGVFACGNALHVHDLVDYVSEEAGRAGIHAARYLNTGAEEPVAFSPEKCSAAEALSVPLIPGNGVRYTVPQSIRPSLMEETLLIRFRVSRVFQNCTVSVWLDDACLVRRKKKKTAPGEMQQLSLKRSALSGKRSMEAITLRIEED